MGCHQQCWYHQEVYKTGQHANADAMSRLPLPYTPDETTVPEKLVFMVEGLQDAPITASQIAQWIRCDPLMARVTRCILEGWPKSLDEELRPHWTRRLELSTHEGCIVWEGSGDPSTSPRTSVS